MALSKNLSVIYTNSMKNQSYGYGLFNPVSSNELQPGHFGFFDSMGAWNPIGNLNDTSTLQRYGLKKPMEELDRAPSETKIRWAPKTSENVRGFRVGVSGKLDPLMTGDVVSIDMHAKYETTSDYGAILLTAYPILRERYYYEGPFRTWVKDNIAALCKGPMASDIAKYGLFVVRQTYATKRCAITSWSNPSKLISMRFQVGASGIANIDTYGGWNVESTDDAGLDTHEASGDDNLVVFVSGLVFRIRKLFSRNLVREMDTPYPSEAKRSGATGEAGDGFGSLERGGESVAYRFSDGQEDYEVVEERIGVSVENSDDEGEGRFDNEDFDDEDY